MRIIAYATRIGTADTVVSASLKRHLSPYNWVKGKSPDVINKRIDATLTKINADMAGASDKEQMAMQVVLRELLKAKKWYEENKLHMVSDARVEASYQGIENRLAA
jgi:hypothetical protein